MLWVCRFFTRADKDGLREIQHTISRCYAVQNCRHVTAPELSSNLIRYDLHSRGRGDKARLPYSDSASYRVPGVNPRLFVSMSFDVPADSDTVPYRLYTKFTRQR